MLVTGEDLKHCTVHSGQQWRVKKPTKFSCTLKFVSSNLDTPKEPRLDEKNFSPIYIHTKMWRSPDKMQTLMWQAFTIVFSSQSPKTYQDARIGVNINSLHHINCMLLKCNRYQVGKHPLHTVCTQSLMLLSNSVWTVTTKKNEDAARSGGTDRDTCT